jgi:N-acyl-D-aspartate/D-glutamate deacylase
MKADIVVFDPTLVNGKATRENPRQLSTGIDFVIVNGVIVIESGRHTGALPGSHLKPIG